MSDWADVLAERECRMSKRFQTSDTEYVEDVALCPKCKNRMESYLEDCNKCGWRFEDGQDINLFGFD